MQSGASRGGQERNLDLGSVSIPDLPLPSHDPQISGVTVWVLRSCTLITQGLVEMLVTRLHPRPAESDTQAGAQQTVFFVFLGFFTYLPTYQPSNPPTHPQTMFYQHCG